MRGFTPLVAPDETQKFPARELETFAEGGKSANVPGL